MFDDGAAAVSGKIALRQSNFHLDSCAAAADAVLTEDSP
jgi:hypothetical protein